MQAHRDSGTAIMITRDWPGCVTLWLCDTADSDLASGLRLTLRSLFKLKSLNSTRHHGAGGQSDLEKDRAWPLKLRRTAFGEALSRCLAAPPPPSAPLSLLFSRSVAIPLALPSHANAVHSIRERF